MNELLQQRIESVQAGRNITHAQLEAKRSLRDRLERDLEDFLASGGKTQVLPIGFTHFKDGLIPQSKTRTISEKERLEKEKLIEAKNQEIREYKEAVKAQRRLLAKNKRDAQIWEDWCKEQELNYLMIHPKANSTKTTSDIFKKRTGWSGRTNEHARDAAMLVFKRFARF